MSELIKSQNFGVEIELTGITRAAAAKVIADELNSPHIIGPSNDCYHTRKVVDSTGRKWSVMRDSSIEPVYPSEDRYSSDEYRVEFVTPILHYEDIEVLQRMVRKLRAAGGKVNASCGIHIHIDGANHSPLSLRRLCNFMVSRQDIIYDSLGVGDRRDRWCRPISKELLDALSENRDLGHDQMEAIWYSRANDGYSGGIDHRHYNPTRYHGVNLHSFFTKGTVEFRLFNSTLHAGKIKAYIQFCLGLSAWSIESKENPNFRPKTGLTASQEVVLMRNILRHRLGMTGDEFETCRYHLMRNLKEAAERQAAA